MNIDLLEKLIMIASASSVIALAFIQKIKVYFTCSKLLPLVSLFVNLVLGVLFSLTFTNVGFPISLWVGLFSFVGADTLYKALEGKLKPLKELKEDDIEEIERNDR